ncbi:MAG: LysM peptidoglycan-binding domain-containing protein [Desulfuromonadaceae bacterium]|nr:LysM peptidoglycan-binding domain-containing protein [Desulfuromonadaceae bacterium]
MRTRARYTTVIAIVLCAALPAWGQQDLLYVPQHVDSSQKAPSREGILVREIKIKKGDTLYDISRTFSGHGMYYPQILLFNSIKNPNLIYSGATLKVPVTQENEEHVSERITAPATASSHKPVAAEAPKTSSKTEVQQHVRKAAGSLPISNPDAELSLKDLKRSGAKKNRTHHVGKKSTGHTKRSALHETPHVKVPAAAQAAVHTKTGATAPATNRPVAGQKLFDSAVKAYRQDDCRTALELLDRYLAEYSASPLAADANLYKANCYLKLSTHQ